jgi:hypothetical protein
MSNTRTPPPISEPTIAPHLIKQLFGECVSAGMTQSQCLYMLQEHFGAPDADTMAAAIKVYASGSSGRVEIDDNALGSAGEDGYWVQAWTLVGPGDIDALWSGDRDSDGTPCRYTNHYRCDYCSLEWSDTWSCACDHDCPQCGDPYSPHTSEFDGPDWLESIMDNTP